MITVYINADFISLNEENATYSVMVVNGKRIAYLGYNTPICYDDERVIDLEGNAVIPIINDYITLTYPHASCTVLAEGEPADFAVLDKNVMKDNDNVKVVDVYIHGKKRK